MVSKYEKEYGKDNEITYYLRQAELLQITTNFCNNFYKNYTI